MRVIKMSLLKRYEEDIEKLKSFFQEFTDEFKKAISHINERYEPIKWIKNNPHIIAVIVAILMIISFYPLFSVWFLACIGTAYPGYRIITSILADRETSALKEKKNTEIREFLHKAAVEQEPIQVPVRNNSRIIIRTVIIRGEMEDGLAVKDPATGIQSKFLWENIDLDALYMSYIQQA